MNPELEEQLEQLQALPAGWWDGKGVPVNPACLGYLREFLRLGWPVQEPMLDLYLTGGVEATWNIERGGNTYSCSFTVEPMEAKA